MKKIEELSYYSWLEDVIRKNQRNSFPENLSPEERDIQTVLLVQQIEKKYPELYEKLLAGTVDATQNSNITQNDVLGFLGKTEKGTCVTWKDMNGNEYLFVNAGQGSGLNKRRILVMGNDNAQKDLKTIKKLVVAELLRKDVEHIYSKIQQKENKRKKSRSYLSEFFSEKNAIVHTAGSFEKNFKKMIKRQGFGSSSLSTAGFLVKTMNASERKKLQSSFASMGVKSGEDLENVLNRWRNEALHERPKIRKNTARTNSMEMGM